jgi:hypothetical protein
MNLRADQRQLMLKAFMCEDICRLLSVRNLAGLGPTFIAVSSRERPKLWGAKSHKPFGLRSGVRAAEHRRSATTRSSRAPTA